MVTSKGVLPMFVAPEVVRATLMAAVPVEKTRAACITNDSEMLEPA